MTVDSWGSEGPPTVEQIDAWVNESPERQKAVERIVNGMLTALTAPPSRMDRLEAVARRIAYSRAHEVEPPGTRPLVRVVAEREPKSPPKHERRFYWFLGRRSGSYPWQETQSGLWLVLSGNVGQTVTGR